MTKVLITGAAGYVASQLLPEFRDRYDLVLVDVQDTDRDGKKVPGVQTADLTNPNPAGYAHLFEGVDAVVHLGYVRSSETANHEPVEPIDRFETELRNVRMANNVYRTAYDAGVRRVVMASSNHAADWYEHALVHSRLLDMVTPQMMPVSDNFYGWAKASYELLGYPYACGIFGRKLEVVQIRIGAPRDVAANHYLGELREQHTGGSGVSNFKRDLGAHLSPRDLRQLVRRSIETPEIQNEHGVPWLVVYGISGNTRAFWSLDSARRVLGYDPEDDSEVKYAEDVFRLLTGPNTHVKGGRVGD